MFIHHMDVYSTKNPFSDYRSDDMQFGDLSEQQLRALGLNDISTKVDPFRLMLLDSPLQDLRSSDDFYATVPPTYSKSCSLKECSDILFDEMRTLAGFFAFYGHYKKIIYDLIDNFQYGNGHIYSSSLLDHMYYSKAFDTLSHSSPGYIVKSVLNEYCRNNINSIGNAYLKERLYNAIF